jgi:hypothetical protein
MSRDHLRCDRLKMRHHDMNRTDVKILDVKMKNRHGHRPKMDRLMTVCLKKDDRMKI